MNYNLYLTVSNFSVDKIVYVGSASLRVTEDKDCEQYALEEGDSEGENFDTIDLGTEGEMIDLLFENVADILMEEISIEDPE